MQRQLFSGFYVYNSYGSGTLQIKITDPPDWGQAAQVYLKYSIIEIHKADAGNESGWFMIIEQSAWINLTKVLNVNQTLGFETRTGGALQPNSLHDSECWHNC
ncbi:MAG: hypothetical protein QG670_1443 [Thermoproteota archaeon]|nr:hypothetical protein [Thermoproteota archaeon]